MSKAISREEVKVKYQAVSAELETLQNVEAVPYKTANKYLPGIGFAHELSSMKEIVKATKFIEAESAGFDTAASGIELTEDEKEEAIADSTILGYSVNVWKSDINNRLVELRREKRINALIKAKKILKKNLSSDDKFELDMEAIGDII